jgi:hypothetical protein
VQPEPRRRGLIALILAASCMVALATPAGATEPRIIGGGPIPIAAAPWQVAIVTPSSQAPGSAFDRQFCGGSLLTSTLVLTAAHCVADEGGGMTRSASDFAVVAGRTNLSSNEGAEVPVSDYTYFVGGGGAQLYDPRTQAWDAVLLKLAAPAPGVPIKIAGADEAPAWGTGRAATISGWGSTQDRGAGYPDPLQAATVVIQPDSACRAIGPLDPTTLCAGRALGDSDTCDGDSGGPLTVTLASGESRLVGDTSYGPKHCGTYDPSAYGRLAADPMRSAIRDAAFAMTGRDVVGSGGSAPSTLSPLEARENAWIYAGSECGRWRSCRSYNAKPCVPSGTAWRCQVFETGKQRRRRISCRRSLTITASPAGIDRAADRKWRCRRR